MALRRSSFESLEARCLLTTGFAQTPEFLGQIAQCGGMHVRSDGETQVGYFSANGGLFGCGGRLDYEGIWRTDGTPEGTWAIGEALGEYPRTETMVEHEGYFYFLVSSNGEGWDDVYRSDGTPDSTTMVGSYLELRPKQPIVTLGSQLIHWDWESSFSSRANRLVATQGGTTQVLLDGGTVQFDRSDEANFRDLRRVGDGVYFGGSHLYRTDGTAAGTDVVRQATRVSFTNQVSPTQQHFWDDTTDGYRLGVISHTTTQLIDHPQLVFEGGSPPLFGTHVWNDSLILRGANDSLLRVSDAEVTELAQGTGRIDFVQEWNGQLVVQAGGRLIVSDGTADGTRQIYSGEIANDRFGRLQVRTTARHLYFAVEQGVFRSNGTLAGTELIETGGKPTTRLLPITLSLGKLASDRTLVAKKHGCWQWTNSNLCVLPNELALSLVGGSDSICVWMTDWLWFRENEPGT